MSVFFQTDMYIPWSDLEMCVLDPKTVYTSCTDHGLSTRDSKIVNFPFLCSFVMYIVPLFYPLVSRLEVPRV